MNDEPNDPDQDDQGDMPRPARIPTHTDELDNPPSNRTRYRPAFAMIVNSMIPQLRAGLSVDKAVANAFGVKPATIRTWRNRYPEFAAAFQQGEKSRIDMVEASLLQVCMGYDRPETKVTYDKDTGEHRSHTYTKAFGPSVPAIMFFLVNRAPERWRRMPDGPQNETLQIVVKRKRAETAIEKRNREADTAEQALALIQKIKQESGA